MTENKDTLIVPLSDLHSGSTTALCPNRFMQFRHTNHTPTNKQVKIWKHFEKCAQEVRKARRRKKVILIHDGDAIDGDHHGTLQIYTRRVSEQMEVHMELMKWFMDAIAWKRDEDELYYVSGTEVHVDDNEDVLAYTLGAKPNGRIHVFDELKLPVNGKNIWFVHHGPTAGKGPNMGNAHRNWLRNIFYEVVQDGETPPDYIITGHTHNPNWGSFISRDNGKYHRVQGLICPSWQAKTKFGYRIAALRKNRVGLQYFTITKDGLISEPTELVENIV